SKGCPPQSAPFADTGAPVVRLSRRRYEQSAASADSAKRKCLAVRPNRCRYPLYRPAEAAHSWVVLSNEVGLDPHLARRRHGTFRCQCGSKDSWSHTIQATGGHGLAAGLKHQDFAVHPKGLSPLSNRPIKPPGV